MKKLVLTLAIGTLLAGCVTPLTDEEIKNGDYGAYPENYEQIVKDYYEKVAKDPDSMKYKEITKPEKYAQAMGRKFGYQVCATVNGKNSYGAYVGYKTAGFLIKNGVIIGQIEDINKHNRAFGTKICQD